MRLIISLFSVVLVFFIISECSGQDGKKGAEADKGQQTSGVKDTEIGLRKYSLNDDSSLPTAPIYSDQTPGKSTKIERSFDNAPPLIPHSTKGFVPITSASNACITCHMPKVAKAMGATPIPVSHLTDSRAVKDLKGKLSQSRYICMTCHVGQATNLKPLVDNKFTAGFSSKEMKSSSNLDFTKEKK